MDQSFTSIPIRVTSAGRVRNCYWPMPFRTSARITVTNESDQRCNAWGFQQQSGLFYGTPLWEGYSTGDRGTAYRFHLQDPVVFTHSLRAEIEHKGSQRFPDGTVSGFIERDDLMSSVALSKRYTQAGLSLS